MATLESRIRKLESDSLTGTENTAPFVPIMGFEEWCAAAATQQADLLRECADEA